MHLTSTLLAGAVAVASAAADNNYLGFNSGATLADRSAKFKKDFEAEFKTAQALNGAPGKFNAVRLYTNIQAYATDDPIEAFEAAIDTQTYMLLGIWASGAADITKEVTALQKAVDKYGSKFTDLVIGMSIGSEDLYRNSVTGTKNKAGLGADPEVIVSFIKDYKKAFDGGALAKVPIGHVDTWDAWTNSSNKAVIDAVDWIGVDEYPYYENGKGNDIKNAGKLFDKAYDATKAVANGKPVWVTETGWPVTGEKWDEAEPSAENAKYYWDEVGCRQLFGKTPTFWYNLRDSNPDNTMKFAITKDLSTTPQFNLTCPTTFDTDSKDSSSSSSSASSTPTSRSNGSTSVSSPTSTGSGSGSTGSTGATSAAGSSGAGASASAQAANNNKASGVGKVAASSSVAGILALVGAFLLL
ncbi:GPI-anchored cell wall beta-1,3-endoglucanase [Cordyceps fumosorosea ARSEF 2679]|uniref:GPI-anchored cell wall beta-1,3-endoglucanase n=1 Tax=Cordyceps fumosorosea (strain ARSEF 2679) TaxID=1081104 RepID=A0A167R056_CORFA|nr:GPI-anchored cell wall beta-1,3-endoglucanase [Cordyceps fumosorosea ARSEF 2679]OAA58149.1 GPI-anchored cell wall beta-1,3-endoglucanase [Cordyceps fumosorosea ARSEF 2679]